MGLPLVEAIYGDDPVIALYALPLLIWYPIQRVVGPLAVDLLKAFVERENRRLGLKDEKDTPSGCDVEHVPLLTTGDVAGKNKRNDKPCELKSIEKSKQVKSRPPVAKNVENSNSGNDLEQGRMDDTMTGQDDTTGSYSDDSAVEAVCSANHDCLQIGVVYERVEQLSDSMYGPWSACKSCYRVVASVENGLGIVPTRSAPIYVCRHCRTSLYCSRCWNDQQLVVPPGTGRGYFVSRLVQALKKYY
jgi:hypothetical protein